MTKGRDGAGASKGQKLRVDSRMALEGNKEPGSKVLGDGHRARDGYWERQRGSRDRQGGFQERSPRHTPIWFGELFPRFGVFPSVVDIATVTSFQQ